MTKLLIEIDIKNGVAETKVSCGFITVESSVAADDDYEAVLKAIAACGSHALDCIETVDDLQ